MKKTVLILVLIISAMSLWAQDALLLDKFDDKTIQPVQLIDITKDATGSYTVTLLKQITGQSLNTTGIFVSGTTTTIVNELQKLKFNTDGSFIDASSEYYSRDGGIKKTGDIYRNAEVSTVSLASIISKYPAIFKEDGYLRITSGISSATITEFEKDLYTLCYVQKDSRTVRIMHPDQEAEKKSITYSQKYELDEQNGFITTFYGRRDFANKENKYNELKDYDFVTYNTKGDVVNRFNVKFPYPKQLDESFPVYSQSEPGKIIGKVFVFARAMLMGKKYSDPEKNNFDIVYCAPDGQLILHKTSKLGTVQKALIFLEGAYGDENSVKLFGNARVEDVLKAGVVELRKDGSEKVNYLTSDEIKANTVYIKDPKAIPVVESRDVLGMTNENAAYKWSLSSDFVIYGLARSGNGDMFLYGQNVYEVDDPKAAQPQPGSTAMTSMSTPKLKKYAEFIAVQIGPDNMPRKFYISQMPVTGERAPLSAVSAGDGTMMISTPVAHLKMGDLQKAVWMFTSLDGKRLSANNLSYMYHPRINAIDPESGEARSLGYSEDYYLLDTENGFLADSDNSKLVICGFTSDQKADKELVVKMVDY